LHLDTFTKSNFDRGRSRLVEALWVAVEGLFFQSWIPGSAWRVSVLRLFGASLGSGVVIKPHVKIKFPWRLSIGDYSWIGEKVWIDNLAEVSIGKNCCLSQGAYLCTGNHRWDSRSFDLVASPIRIEDHCWIGAMAQIAPGVCCGEGAVLAMGSLASSNLEKWHIHSGAPAKAVKSRPVTQKSVDA
jgi:putative colanic acid biosynthesis acetyltransferase WcaF